jgi:hypothetical protein
MPVDKDVKRLVRARMAATNENYTTARVVFKRWFGLTTGQLMGAVLQPCAATCG